MSISLKTLTARFSLPLRPRDIPAWRGAVAEAAGWEQDLFHNHAPARVGPEVPEPVAELPQGQPQPERRATLKDTYLHRYPLIHYRVSRGQASLWGLNEGAQALRRWLLAQEAPLEMGGRRYSLQIAELQERQYRLEIAGAQRTYRLMDYLALNQENYLAWQQAPNLMVRMQLLEGALTGHILGFCTAVGYHIPDRALEVSLLHLREARPVRLHGVERLAFNLIFRTNLTLPPQLALGKGVSHGFGLLMPTRTT